MLGRPGRGGQFSATRRRRKQKSRESPRLWQCARRLLFPKPLGERQSAEFRLRERPVGCDAGALEDCDELTTVLRRVPGRALEEFMQRLVAVIGFYRLAPTRVLRTAPPLLEALDDAVAVARDFRGALHGAFRGRLLGMVFRVFL